MKRIAHGDTTGRNRRAGKDPAGRSGKRPYCFMIHRYSSRRSPLKDFLATQLQGARRYDRIAGFFSSSLLEVAGEALERMTPDDGETCVRMVCNSSLNPLDVQTAREAMWGMHREWCALRSPPRSAHPEGQASAAIAFRFTSGEGGR